MKKALAALTLFLSLALSGHAATFGDFTYQTADSQVTITRYSGPGGAVTIPDKIDNLPVTSIRYNAFLSTGLTSVTIPNSVTSIGSSAFSGCSGLTSVTIGSGVTSIGQYAFNNCTGLTSVTIPNSVTSIGIAAFWRCYGLTSVTIPNSVTSIGDSAFQSCTGLTSVTIPNSVTSMGDQAFAFCTDLTSVTIGSGVTSIGYGAFNQCSGLTSVTIGIGVTSIGQKAFYNCTGLTSVTIPNSVTSIGDSAFYECTSLSGVTIGSSVTSIGDSAFIDCTSLTSVTIGSGVTSIGKGAFSRCSRLTSVTIPNSVTSIGNEVFIDCTGLTSVTIGSGVTSIGQQAFYNCTGLKSVTIGSGVTSIGQQAFYNCTGLTSVTIGSGVTSIGQFAFHNCTGLTSVTIPNSVTNIGDFAFYICTGLRSLTIGSGVTSIGRYAFSACYGLTSVTIPNSVTSIGGSAFYNCTGLTSVIIPSGVWAIEANAPWGSSAQIIRVDPPVIAVQPFSAIVKLGNDTTFSVTATGMNLSYQWQKNGVDIAGATQTTLSLGNVQPADAGSYAVVVSNAWSVQSGAATLSMLEVPVISSQPSSVTVAAGQSTSLGVSATGNGTLSYQWQKDGVNVAEGTQATLSLGNVQTADAGSYMVVVSNAIDGVMNALTMTSRAATFTVVSTPVISVQPANATLNVGQNASFSIRAAGNGTLSYQWQKGGVDIAGATQTTLSLGNVQPADAGSYAVVIRNTLNGVVNSASSSEATLTVVVKPTITSQPTSLVLNPGQGASFSVAATGSAASYQWRKNEANIAGATGATLAFKNISASDAASYTVVASNAAGSVTSGAATLTVNAATYRLLRTSDGPEAPLYFDNYQYAPIILTVSADDLAGFSNPQLSWSRTPNSWIKLTDSSLMILDPDDTDAGIYSVTITGDDSKSATISLTLEAAAVKTPSIGYVQETSALVGQVINIHGQNFTNTTSVTINDTAVAFQFVDDSLIKAWMPTDAAVGLIRVWKGSLSSTSGSVILKQPLAKFTISAYGNNQYGQTSIPNFSGKSLYGLAAGANHNVALLNNSISIWGSKNNSDMPKASYGNFASVPDEAVIKASAGSDFTVVLQKNGMATAWGENSSGQATVTKDLPQGASVAAGSYHAFLLSTTGKIYGWGNDSIGQRSGGSALDRVISVRGADQFSAALRSEGGLYAWGTNANGQTNLDSVLGNQALPNQYMRQKRLMQFALGKSHALGLRRDGTVVAWGYNQDGQCDVPAGLDHVIALAAGNYHSLALKDDGTVVTWGKIMNSTGTLVDCVVPMADNQRVVGIASGLSHFLLMKDTSSPALVVAALPAPVIVAQPTSTSVNQSASASFSVSTVGSGPYTYQWRKAGQDIWNSTSATLTLKNAQLSDMGSYTVTVTNAGGSTTSEVATLTVIAPPTSISIQPASQIAYFGGTITLTPIVSFRPSGASPVNYQWYKDGVEIHDAAGASLTLTNLLDTHSGNYYVVANNSAGTQKSNDVSLTVTKGTTTITEEPTASPITSGQTLASSSLSGGVASIAGVFAFTTLNTAPSVGITWQEYTFTPTDLTNYNTVTGMVSVTVSNLTSKATTVTTAPVATSITYGQTLASSPLNGGVGSVTGTFAFTKPSTAPNAGTALQGYTFTPTDLINYSPVTGTVSVTVNKATPTITTAPVASAIAYGQTLAASTLSGGVGSVAGAFVFTTPNNAPSDGASFQEYTFTPTESSNYNTVSGTVSVMVSVTVNQFYSRVGEEMQLDLTKFGSSGAMKLVGALPKGLTFNSKTEILGGKITGKAGNYPLKLQFLSGKTVLSSIDLTLIVGAYPSGLVGTFKGLLKANGSELPGGMVSLTVVAPGTWSASLDLAGSSKVLSAKGSFSLDSTQAAVDLTIPFSTAMKVHLRLDPSSALVNGDYPQGIVEGFRMASGSELPTRSQLFNLTIDQDAQDGMAIPAGMGWATGTVSNKGAIALTGQLGDGKAIKIATQLSATGQAIVWLKPYKNRNSFVGGIVSLRDRGLVKNGSDEPLTEGLWWYRVADAKEPSYPNGFGPLQADAGIAPYAVPANAAALAMSLGLPTATFPNVIIDGGGLPDSITASLPTSMTLDNAFKLKAVPALLAWSGTVNKANGSFSGTLTLPTSASDVLVGPAKVSGVLLGGSYYSPYVGSGLVKIPLKSPKGSFRTAAIVTSSEAP